jgi:hypothetical protein
LNSHHYLWGFWVVEGRGRSKSISCSKSTIWSIISISAAADAVKTSCRDISAGFWFERRLWNFNFFPQIFFGDMETSWMNPLL